MDCNKTPESKILFAVTSPLACTFYNAGLLKYLRTAGFEPTLLSSPGANLITVSQHEGAHSIAVPMEREIAPLQDLVSLWRLYRTIRSVRPTIVDASTPKAGLLTGIAAWLARVRCRVYTLRGLRLETATGLKRAVLWAAEWIACACSDRVVCVSPSLRERTIGLKLVSPNKVTVLGKGSGGVDVHRFTPDNRNSETTDILRKRLCIPRDAPVIGFVGRFVKDKGIRQLVEAAQEIRKSRPELRLLLVGDFEQGDPVEPAIRRFIETAPEVTRPGFVADTAPYYGLMDVLVLPTYREGFPGVPLEAQASGVPVVTTMATGARDSVIDGETGILVPVGDAKALAAAIDRLLTDTQLRESMGRAGRMRMQQDFRPEVIWNEQVKMYNDLLESKARKSDLEEAAFATAGSDIGKRVFDLLAASVAVVLLFPVLMIVALVVRVFFGAPILFRQARPGLKGQLFNCLKFRTMTDARDAHGRLLPDADRLTWLGKLLRSTSLDELPELINVIRGEMSLVGPRPLLARYLERYTPEQMRRHDVKPGITGWAQINGRNALNWNQKFELDLWYVDHRSFWLDVKILLMTVWKLFTRDGISQPGHVTMPEYMGMSAVQDKAKAAHGGAL
ncbi:MAG TPA: sugar transferase [Terriglobales bacterium]|nr:sugar transferase [Terriglobales bacterium]